MDNKTKINNAAVLVTGLVIVLGIIGVWFLFSTISPSEIKTSAPKNNSSFDKDLYNKITTPVSYGSDVSIDEPGFGRDNPFTPYK